MQEIIDALRLRAPLAVKGPPFLPSCFDVAGLARRSVGAVAQSLADFLEVVGCGTAVRPTVNQPLAGHWFGTSVLPIGWELPPLWDAMAGDYRTADGWIRLHTNLPQHRAAACAVLGTAPQREAVEPVVANWEADELESAIVNAGGVAAAMRSLEAWRHHPQGAAVQAEPLVAWETTDNVDVNKWCLAPTVDRPLRGLRVLDLTRVLAGPVCTRALAGLGATVLRIDPPGWDEANVVPDVTLGKYCATLDLKSTDDLVQLKQLMAEADVFVHGYRPGALDTLGIGDEERASLNPRMIDVALCAYGWTGPWSRRRGFDSLVQMSCGIAEAGMQWKPAAAPTPLPVQALDHATGYLMAAAVLTALRERLRSGTIQRARLSLARTAALLVEHPADDQTPCAATTALPNDYADDIEATPWGPARRLASPFSVGGAHLWWERAASDLGAVAAEWQ